MIVDKYKMTVDWLQINRSNGTFFFYIHSMFTNMTSESLSILT